MRTQRQLSNKLVRGLSNLLGQEFVSFWLEQSGSTTSNTRCLARVTRIEKETADAVSIWLQPNELFTGFEAGQHVNLSVSVGGMIHTRSYSFSNAPVQSGLIRLTIKQTPQGVVSRYAVNELQVGEVVELGDVFGDMTLTNTQPELATKGAEMVLMAAGSGITPMMSLIESLEGMGWPAKVTLMYWARNAEDVIFDEALKTRAAASSNFNYVRILEDGAVAERGDLTGRPDASQLKKTVANLGSSHVYVCGPDGFMNAIKKMVGDKPASFHAESFTPAVLVADENAPVQTFKVTLTRSNKIVEVPNNKPLLKALQEQGINPPHGCGMGICNTCSCEKLVGTTQNMQNKTVCGESNAPLRLCISAVQGPVSLDL